MEDTSGFYKLDGEVLLYGTHFVLNANYELRKETNSEHSYPVDGWYWFDTEQKAKDFFGIVEEDKQKWADYRQELRDVTKQQYPYNIVWPVEPNADSM